MNIQISDEQVDVIEEMIILHGSQISVEGAILEMLNDDILDVARILDDLKELKSNQEKLTKRPKLYIVK